jgi:hypothetical protein
VHSGFHQEITDPIGAIRDALEHRTEARILHGESASDRQLKAFRRARQGHLGSVVLGHLVDEDDSSTKANPLSGLSSSPDTAHTKLLLRLNRLQIVLAFAAPRSASRSQPFISKLSERLGEYIQEGASTAELSAFYRKVMVQVCAPVERAHFSRSGLAEPDYDIKHITANSQYRRQIESDIALRQQKKIAAEAAQAAASKRPLQPDNPNNPNGGAKKTKKQKKAEKAAELAKKATAPGKVEHAAGVDKTASPVPLPAKSDKAAWDAFHAQHPGGTHPKTGKAAKSCFDFHHPQGCKRGENCLFFHE